MYQRVPLQLDDRVDDVSVPKCLCISQAWPMRRLLQT